MNKKSTPHCVIPSNLVGTVNCYSHGECGKFDEITNVCITNDVGGTTFLPPAQYKVRLKSAWSDYEIGRRCIGELINPEDIERARVIGTTGFKPEDYQKYSEDHVNEVRDAQMNFRPEIVYFSADDFTIGS